MHWSRAELQDRLSHFERDRKALVLTHDFPDPDSLASAAALASLLRNTRGLDVTIGFGGFIGRAENRQMVSVLEIPAVPVETLDLADFPYLALVDSQPETGNNALPAGRRPDIVVDHHPPRPTSAGVVWLDIHEEAGACATLVLDYLRQLGLPIGPKLATALFYAVKSETQDLVRESHPCDVEAYRYLLPLIDRDLLGEILNPPVSPAYFQLLSRAVDRSRLYGPLLVVDLQTVPFPEIVAEVADLMLRHEGIRWVLSLGQMAGDIYLSVRTRDPATNAGELIRKVVGGDGTAGGHGTMAGGRAPAPDLAAARCLVATFTNRVRDLLQLENLPENRI